MTAPATKPAPPPTDLVVVPDSELDPIITAMKDRQSCNRVMGCKGAAELVAKGSGIIPRLAREISEHPTDDGYWTTQFIDVMSQLHNARAVPTLRGYIGDKRWELNYTSIRALGRLAPDLDQATRRALADELLQSVDGPLAALDVSRVAATHFALARLVPSEKTTQDAALLAMLPQTRAASEAMPAPHLDTVVLLVAEARLTHGLPGIRWAALSQNRFVSVHALDALGAMMDTGGVPYALERLADENPTVRKTAIAALQQITGARTITTAEAWRDWAAQHGLDKIPE